MTARTLDDAARRARAREVQTIRHRLTDVAVLEGHDPVALGVLAEVLHDLGLRATMPPRDALQPWQRALLGMPDDVADRLLEVAMTLEPADTGSHLDVIPEPEAWRPVDDLELRDRLVDALAAQGHVAEWELSRQVCSGCAKAWPCPTAAVAFDRAFAGRS